MLNLFLILHLLITIALVGLVLIQRSEGGGLGLGGGGGGAGGFMTTRGTASALTRMTMLLATAFFVTSILLSILGGMQTGSTSSILDLGVEEETAPAPDSAPIDLPDTEPDAPAEETVPEVPVGD